MSKTERDWKDMYFEAARNLGTNGKLLTEYKATLTEVLEFLDQLMNDPGMEIDYAELENQMDAIKEELSK